MIRRFAFMAALLGSSCIGFDALTGPERARVDAFDFYWQQLTDDYPFFGKAHVDWSEIRRQYRSAVPFAERPHQFLHLLTGMFSELGDPHVSFEPADEQWTENGVAPTSVLDRHGFEMMLVEGKLHVIGWPAGDAPELPQGLPHAARFPELWRVGGFHVVTSLVRNLMVGPPDSLAELQLRWNDELVTRHVVRRPAAGTELHNGLLSYASPSGSEPATFDDDGKFAHLSLNTIGLDLDVDMIDKWIDTARQSEGLVLDLRRNLGGNMDVFQQLIARFLKKPAELVFVTPTESATAVWPFSFELFLRTLIKPRGQRYDKPLVVLTSSMTASMAEHTAQILQRECGAIVIGERTVGAEAGIETVRGPDGGLLRYGETRIVDRTGIGLQAEGVVPDVSIRLRIEDVAAFGPNRAIRDWQQRLFDAAVRAIRNMPKDR